MDRFLNSPRTAFAAVVVIAIAGVAIFALTDLPSANPPAGSAHSAAAGATCDPARAREVVEASRSSGLIQTYGMDTDGLTLVVGAQAGAAMVHADQAQLVAAWDCAVAGPDYLRRVTIKSAVGGSTVASFEAADLLALRESGLPR